jgi:hypothetical protein
MIRQIIGAAIGSKLAKQTPAVGGAAGAAIGSVVPFVISRLSIPTMIAVGAGGYFAKRFWDKKQAEDNEVQLAGTSVKGTGFDDADAKSVGGKSIGTARKTGASKSSSSKAVSGKSNSMKTPKTSTGTVIDPPPGGAAPV